MKKRLLAVILALSISSVNTMGAFAMASEGGATSQVVAEDGSEGNTEDEESENSEESTVVEEASSNGADVGSAENEESVTSNEDEGDGTGIDDDNSDGGAAGAGDDESVGTGDRQGGSVTGSDNEQGDETSQEGSSIGDGQTEPGDGDVLTEGQEGETTADVMSGECGADGDNLTWELSGEADALDLTIHGEGAMADYSEEAGAPWEKSAANIVTISISDGVTEIGSYAFAGCSSVEEFYFSENILGIGENAFLACDSLKRIYYAGTQEAWDSLAQNLIPEGVEVVCVRVSEIAVTKVMLGMQESELEVGEQLQLTATIEPEDATNKNVMWSSSSEEVATVADNGLVTGVGVGTATVSVLTEDGLYSDECVITVKDSESAEIASGICGYKLTWKLTGTDDDMTLTISGTGEMKDYSINSNYNSEPWKIYKDRIKSVVVEEGVTYIGDCAFHECTSLTSIEFPEGLQTIGSSVFSGCTSLTNIELPEGLQTIRNHAFYKCTSLTNIELPKGLQIIGNSVFYECTSLTNIELPDGLQSIGSYAFSRCTRLKSIELPEGLQTIGSNAFDGCANLISIELPKGLRRIYDYAFYGCYRLTNIELQDGLQTIGSYAFSGCTNLTNIELPEGLQTIGSNAFYGCISLTNIELPEGLQTIGSYAFYRCTSLTNIELPEGLQTIDEYTFYECKGLTGIGFPEGLQSIGGCAFYGCTSLTNIELADGLQTIGGSAFYGCTSLTNIELPVGLQTIGRSAFYGCTSLTNIELPEGLQTIGGCAFYGCYSLRNIKLPEGIKNIYDYAFYGCYRLANIELPEGLQTIGGYAFSGCTNLRSIKLPEGFRRIYEYAFYECTFLRSIELPEGLQTIGSYAFSNSGLRNIELPEGLQTIRSHTFEGCTSLINAELPEGLQTIESYVFSGCTNLTSIELSEGLQTIDEYAFSGCSRLTNTELPEGLQTIGSHAFEGCTSLTNIELPEGLQIIDEYAFSECKGLTSIGFPEGLQTIGSHAFYHCTSSTNIELPEGLQTIEEYAFYGCTSLTNIELPEGLQTIESYAFSYSGLRNIELPEGLQTIGRFAFYFNHLTNIDLPKGLQTIEEYAFYGCKELTSIEFPEGLQTIGKSAFSNCTSLKSIDIPGSVSSISSSAFSVCPGIINYWGTSDNWNQVYSGTNTSNVKFLHTEFDTNELILNPGQEQNLHIVSDFGDTYFDNIIWTSSDDEIASIDNEGKVTAKKQGDVVITASLYSVECQLPISVIMPITEFQLDQHDVTLLKNETITLGSTHEPQDAIIKKIYWKSSNPEIVSIDENGQLTALKVGSADITASVFGGDKTDSCTVTVIALVSAVELERDDVYVGLNEEGRLNALVYPEDATNKSVKWTSSDEEIANIDDDGNIHGNSLGTAEITATTEDGSFTATCQVHVVIPVAEVAFEKDGVTLDKGQTGTISATIIPEDAFDKSITWKSSDSQVVTVDTEGNTTAIGVGSAVITATSSNGKSAQCAVEVKLPFFGISYILNGGTNNQNNPKQYCEADAIVLNAPTRKGYIFGGWYLDAAFTKKATGIAAGQTGDKTFYAKWTGKTYKIVFNGNTANSGKMSKITYTMGKSTALPANAFVKKEYVFNGWNTRADGKGTKFNNKGALGAFDAANGSTVTLYAQWKIKQYTITYKLNGGTNNKANPASYNFKSANITLAKPTRKGYSFQGWFTDAKCTKAFTGIKKGSTGNKTVYAKWKANKYTIQYVLNRGTAPKGNPAAYYVTTATITLKNPTRKGYTFLGWYKEATFKTKVVSIPKGSVGNLKLYAKWTATKYTIMYNLNGGTNNKNNPAVYTITTANITLTNPSRKGYTFAGWYTDSKFKNKITVIQKGSTGKRMLYAKWKLNTYTINYVVNGGKLPSGSPTKYNANSSLALMIPTRNGYTFAGWYKDAQFKTKITSIPKGSVGNLKLYAKWNAINYSITYILNGGTNSEENPSGYNVTTAVTLKNPMRKGYTFSGWYKDSDCTNRVTGITAGSGGSKVFYAKWTANKYSIIFNANTNTVGCGYTGTMSTITCTYGKQHTLPINKFNVDDDEYEFTGWNTNADGSGLQYDDSAVVKNLSSKNGETITLYAMWGKKKSAVEENIDNLVLYIIKNGTNKNGNISIAMNDIKLDDSIEADSILTYLTSKGILAFCAKFTTRAGDITAQMDYDLINHEYLGMAIGCQLNNGRGFATEVEIIPSTHTLLQDITLLSYSAYPTSNALDESFIYPVSKEYTKDAFVVWELLLQYKPKMKFTELGFPVLY